MVLDPPVALEEPSLALVVEDEREVPASDVFALEDTLLEVAAGVNTVEVEAAVDAGDRAEVGLTGVVADVVAVTLELSGDVEETGAETPAVEDGLNNALPEDGVTPDPAPDDEPAVLAVVSEAVLLVKDDWM
jgi:hypothetical protein